MIEQGNAVRHRSVEDVFREYFGQEVWIRDASNIAKRYNAYVPGTITSLPINGVYELKTNGKREKLRCEYLLDMLAVEKS